MRRRIRPLIGFFLSILFLSLCLTPQVKTVLCLPASQKMVVGEASVINIDLPGSLQEKIEMKVMGPSRSVFASTEDSPIIVNKNGSSYEIRALKPGKADIRLNLLGYIPIKSIQVEAIASKRVVAGGHSIGVVLQSKGIMVVGFAPVIAASAEKEYPARDQGIKIGDLIFRVGGQDVSTETDLARIIDNNKDKEIKVELKREGEDKVIQVKPVFCPETERYRIGLYVRDGVVGVGTLTFWDPDSSQYAALGHIIVDADTKKGIDVRQGRIVSANIQTIKPGKPGRPGEKIGIFDDQGEVSGNIIKNTFFGIYGKTDTDITNPLSQYTMEVVYAHQVIPGKAQMLTVVNGEDIEKFDIEIEKVYPQRQNGKGMIIKVTDPRLLSITGGIVQGMSGSPIIQGDNKIVGAVTHVFLNDPSSGYAIFMDNMLSEIPTGSEES